MMSTKSSLDNAEAFFKLGFHAPTRTIYLGSASGDEELNEAGVGYEMADRAIKALHLLDQSPAPNPITIIMNNPGGDFYHGMAIFDSIQACKNHITIRATGYAMSMGSIILQAADDRVLTPNAKVMIHYGYAGNYDHPKIVKNWALEYDKNNDWVEKLYLAKIQEKHPEYTQQQVIAMCNFDTILNAQEAVDLGLADRITTL